MKSKIRVEYDFDKKEPYIQFYLEKDLEGENDLRDGMLKDLIQSGTGHPIRIWYPSINGDNSTPQIRLQDKNTFITSMETFCHSLFKDNDKAHLEINDFFGKMSQAIY